MLLLLTSKSRNKDYKLVTGKLREHFGFKLDDDNKVTDGEKVYCFHCDIKVSSFAAQIHR